MNSCVPTAKPSIPPAPAPARAVPAPRRASYAELLSTAAQIACVSADNTPIAVGEIAYAVRKNPKTLLRRSESVAHTLTEYLPVRRRSSTRCCASNISPPVVLARRAVNLSEFPLDGVVLELDSSDTVWTRLNRRFPVLPAAARDPYVRRVTNEAKRHGCVLLHAHFGWSRPTTLSAARQLGLPLVTTFYGRDLAHRKRRWQRRDAYGELFSGGTLFVCEGPVMVEHLAGLGCPREKIRVVRVGIDLADFPFEPRVRSGSLIVLQAARLVEKKGVDLSIRAFARARSEIGAGGAVDRRRRRAPA